MKCFFLHIILGMGLGHFFCQPTAWDTYRDARLLGSNDKCLYKKENIWLSKLITIDVQTVKVSYWADIQWL